MKTIFSGIVAKAMRCFVGSKSENGSCTSECTLEHNTEGVGIGVRDRRASSLGTKPKFRY